MPIWALRAYGVRRTSPLQWLVVAALTLISLQAAFGPYLDRVATDDLTERTTQVFMAWSQIAPWGERSLGWLTYGLAILALLPARLLPRASAPEPECRHGGATPAPLGDPRWALLAGVVVVAVLAAGGNAGDRALARALGDPPPMALPNPYEWLSWLLPGLR